MNDSANTGHGHVRPRPDGVKMRCGGTAICAECAKEAAQLAAATTDAGSLATWTDKPSKTGAYWFQLCGAAPDICWVHNGMVWFLPSFLHDAKYVSAYEQYGKCFWGPIAGPMDQQTMPPDGMME